MALPASVSEAELSALRREPKRWFARREDRRLEAFTRSTATASTSSNRSGMCPRSPLQTRGRHALLLSPVMVGFGADARHTAHLERGPHPRHGRARPHDRRIRRREVGDRPHPGRVQLRLQPGGDAPQLGNREPFHQLLPIRRSDVRPNAHPSNGATLFAHLFASLAVVRVFERRRRRRARRRGSRGGP